MNEPSILETQQQKFASLQSEFFKKSIVDTSTQKSCSPPSRKKYRNKQHHKNNKFMVPQPIQDSLMQLRVRDKFDNLYQKIQQIAMRQQLIKTPQQSKKFSLSSKQEYNKKCDIEGISTFDVKARGYKSKSMITPRFEKLSNFSNGSEQKIQERKGDKQSLQINYTRQSNSKVKQQRQSYSQMILMRKTRYKPRLQPIRNLNLSNKIKDYLSVQKINIRDLEMSISPPKLSKGKGNYSFVQSSNSNLLELNESLRKQSRSTKQKLPIVRLALNKKKFIAPFQTYFYRDFVWRAGYSNSLMMQIPGEYPFKVKAYVGRGNNSRLVKGIICRRNWYQITDRIQQANFVWTQVRSSSYMSLQSNQKPKQPFQQQNIQYVEQGSIFNQEEQAKFYAYWRQNKVSESKSKQDFAHRNRAFKIKPAKLATVQNIKIHNHFKNNFIIGNKKALFQTMSAYYKSTLQNIFDYLPLTFHIKNGIQDDEYLNFLKYFYQQSKKSKKQEPGKAKSYNVWVVKPGELTNQGNGIIVCLTLQQIKAILKRKQRHFDGTLKTFIVQKYIQRPLLYKKRKFDLRHYMMITCLNGATKGYWCKQGYVRTTSSQYTLKFSSGSVHLTNDAVQKHLPDYGKYQKGNKLFYEDLNRYIRKNNHKIDFYKHIYPKMRKICIDTIKASARSLDQNKKNNMQIFGMDFMIDENYNVWLIEVNTNPCLQTTCPVLNGVIPKVLENAFELFLDPIFPAPKQFNPKSKVFYQNCVEDNIFELVYDQRQFNSESVIVNQLQFDKKLQEEQDDFFQDDGQDFCQD